MRVLKLSLLFTLSLFFGAVVASNFMGGEEADASHYFSPCGRVGGFHLLRY